MSQSSNSKLVVGTRDSILARLQTDLALKAISKRFPEIEFEIIAVKTSGDKILNKPLAELGGRGVFVKELEESLLERSVDFVVHSLKDLPTAMPEGLILAATIDRADPRDVLVSKNGQTFATLPSGSKVATSSRRRAAQLNAIRTDLQFTDIRGNIQTRMRKLDEGQCDAMVLAAAGLIRLGLENRISQFFEFDQSTPAVGQGAMGIECREDNERVLQILREINEADVWSCTTAERAFLNKLGGGCSVPVGAIASVVAAGQIELKVCVAALDGKQVFKSSGRAAAADASKLGSDLADEMIKAGAGKIVEALLQAPISAVSPP